MKEKIKESLFKDYYIYSPIIYKLLEENKLDFYINELENNKKYMNFKNIKIEYYKHFIMMIDNFIDYIFNSLNLTNIQLLNILESIFTNLKNPIFFSNHYIKENNKLNKYTSEYKKIILEKFRKNFKFVETRIGDRINFYNVDFDDDKSLFNFLIDCCNVRKNHQYILFDDFNEYLDNNKKIDFYILMWKLMFQKLDEYYEENNLFT